MVSLSLDTYNWQKISVIKKKKVFLITKLVGNTCTGSILLIKKKKERKSPEKYNFHLMETIEAMHYHTMIDKNQLVQNKINTEIVDFVIQNHPRCGLSPSPHQQNRLFQCMLATVACKAL